MKTPIEEIIEEISLDIQGLEIKKDVTHKMSMKNSFINREQIRLRKVLKTLNSKLEKEKQAIIDSIVDFQKQKRLNNPIIELGDNWKEIDEKYFRDLAEQYYNQKYNK